MTKSRKKNIDLVKNPLVFACFWNFFLQNAKFLHSENIEQKWIAYTKKVGRNYYINKKESLSSNPFPTGDTPIQISPLT